jgi:hypothetical protein
MFELQKDQSHPVISLVFQLLMVPLVTLMVTRPLFFCTGVLFGVPPPRGTIRASDVRDVVVIVIVLLTVGFLLGRFVRIHLPSVRPVGLWIWPLPVGLFVYGFAKFWNHPLLHDRVLTLHFQGTLNADEGLQYLFATLPAFSNIGYSLGLLVSKASSIVFRGETT